MDRASCVDRPRVHVLLASDRQGHMVSALGLHLAPRLTSEAIEIALRGRIEGRPDLASTAELRFPCLRLARDAGLTYHPLQQPALEAWSRGTGDRRVRSPAHVRGVSHYRSRLKEWLWWFRGVATKYLPNYLLWHRQLDQSRRHRLEVLMLRWPSGG